MKKFLVFIALVTVAFTSCKKDEFDAAKQAQKDEEMIKAYLKARNVTAQKDTASGLYYSIQTPGTGIQPTSSSIVTVTYKGEIMATGSVFDQGADVELPLSNTIQGWKIGIPKIREGGRIILYIPSGLAYKNRNNGPIPANSVLVFTVDLLDVDIS